MLIDNGAITLTFSNVSLTWPKSMQTSQIGQEAADQNRWRAKPWKGGKPTPRDRIIPNPKLKLLDQVTEIMRLRHYSIRTERCYCDWIRRYPQSNTVFPAGSDGLAEQCARSWPFPPTPRINGLVAPTRR